MSSYMNVGTQRARKTHVNSNVPIEPVAGTLSVRKRDPIIDTHGGDQEDVYRSPGTVSAHSSSGPKESSLDSISPARNSAGFHKTGGKGPAYIPRMKTLHGLQVFNEVSASFDGEEGSEIEDSEDAATEEEDENEDDDEQEDEENGDDEKPEDSVSEEPEAGDDEDSLLFSRMGAHSIPRSEKTGKKTVGVTHLEGLYVNHIHDASSSGSLTSSRGPASNPTSMEAPKLVAPANGSTLNAGGFASTSRKMAAQGTFIDAHKISVSPAPSITDGTNTGFASINPPTALKQRKPRATKVLLKDKVLLPLTLCKKYNRREMNQLLIEFGEHPESERFKSLKAQELATYLNDRQQRYVDSLANARESENVDEDTIPMDLEYEDKTLVDAGPIDTCSSRKRARADSEVEEDYMNPAVKKAKTDQVDDGSEIIQSHTADSIPSHEAVGNMGTPMGVEDITKALHAIKRAALRDIELQRLELLPSQRNGDLNIGSYQTNRMTICFDTQDNPHISLNAQVSVHRILRIKGKILPKYQQPELSEDEEWNLSKDLDTFQALLRRLSTAIANKMFDENVNKGQVTRGLVNELFAHDIEDGRI